jgi:hypothetical protein
MGCIAGCDAADHICGLIEKTRRGVLRYENIVVDFKKIGSDPGPSGRLSGGLIPPPPCYPAVRKSQ